MTYKNLTFYNHNYQGCLCKTITSKRIELERRGWSGLVGLEILFPTVIWFLMFGRISAKVWVTLEQSKRGVFSESQIFILS